MTLILILLGLLIILIILRLFVTKEGFQNTPLNPVTIQGYNNFLSFYNPFCTNWKKAIISSVASELPQQPLTDPSQVQSSSAPDIPESDMNNYIQTLSSQLSQEFPPICQPLPSALDSSNLPDIITKIPTDTQPFTNALNWMNKQLQKSQANLGSALQGNSAPPEAFEDMCQDISSCLANNPSLIQQIAIELSEQNDNKLVQEQEQLMKLMIPFFDTPDLSQALGENTLLVEKAKEIQDQAQSGELVNQINVPGGNSIAKYDMPPGANNMNDMKKNNPDRYNELKTNYSQWFSLKSMIDNINANL